MKPSSNPKDEHDVVSYRTDNSRGNPPPPALSALLSSRRPDPPRASCSLWGIRDPPPSPYQPDDLKPHAGKMQDPPSLQQKDVDSSSSAEADIEECLCHGYSDTYPNDEDEKYNTQIDDDEEEQGEEMDDTELDDEGLELWLSNASLLSSLSGASPQTLSASASFNCSLNHFEKSWSRRTSIDSDDKPLTFKPRSRRTSIDSDDKPLTFKPRSRRTSIDSDDKPPTIKPRGFMMIGDDLEPVHRLNMEKIQEQRMSVTAAAESSSAAAARVVDGEIILGDSCGHCEFTTLESPSLPPPITSTTPAPSTTPGTQSVAEAAIMLSRWRFQSTRRRFQGRRRTTMTATSTTTTKSR